VPAPLRFHAERTTDRGAERHQRATRLGADALQRRRRRRLDGRQAPLRGQAQQKGQVLAAHRDQVPAGSDDGRWDSLAWYQAGPVSVIYLSDLYIYFGWFVVVWGTSNIDRKEVYLHVEAWLQ
jgi:hypothetical protein